MEFLKSRAAPSTTESSIRGVNSLLSFQVTLTCDVVLYLRYHLWFAALRMCCKTSLTSWLAVYPG